MKSVIKGVVLTAALTLTAGLAGTAQASSISTYLNAYVADPDLNPSSSDDYQQYAEDVTQGLTPTSYSATAIFGGGSSYSNATVSFGSVHASQMSNFELRSDAGDAQGYVHIFIDDTGSAKQSSFATPSYSLTGTKSGSQTNGHSTSTLYLIYTVSDHTNNTSTQFVVDTASPGANESGAPLNVTIGDAIETTVMLNIDVYQDNQAFFAGAYADYSHTFDYYLTNFSSSSGHNYDPSAATPLPAALPLFASGLGALGLFVRRRTRISPRTDRPA